MTREEAARILDGAEVMILSRDEKAFCKAAIMAIEALRRLDALAVDGEHDEGCAWCKADYTIIDDDFGQPIRKKMIKFCWHCGRKLKEEHNAE